ncbi:MAG: hypothetical protein K2M97_05700, partial [Muribaculaceae bacterium]|nr:hypothetical protein [Muribaculaceae bacterium]
GYNQVNFSYASQGYNYSMKVGDILNGATSGNAGDIEASNGNDISLQGFGLEYIRGFKVSKKYPMFVEAGVNFNFTFGKAFGMSSQHIGMNIPISYAYKFNIKDKFAIKPYVGIDFKVSLVGRSKEVDSDDDSEWGNWYSEEFNDPAWKRFNLGWHLGADFQYRRYNIGFAFTSDITKVASNKYFKVSNNAFALKLGYTF